MNCEAKPDPQITINDEIKSVGPGATVSCTF